MAEVEDGRIIEINGTSMDEMKIETIDDNNETMDGINEAALEKEISEELSCMEVTEQAVENGKVNDDLDQNEINEAENEMEKLAQTIKEDAVEEQIIEDRTEDQVPDITGTDNADVMATSMDSIDELPTSEEQAVESSTLAELETLPVESETDNTEVSPLMEAETPLEENKIDIDFNIEAPQEVNEAGVEKKILPVEKTTPVSTEAPQADVKDGDLPREEDLPTPRAKSEELETGELNQAPLEVGEEIQDKVNYKKAAEAMQRVDTEQSFGTNKSEDIMDELSEAGPEEIERAEDFDNAGSEAESAEFADGEQQVKAGNVEAEESSFASEKEKETSRSSRASSLKLEETTDEAMTNQECTVIERKPSSKKSITDDEVLSRKTSTIEEKNRKISAVDEIPSRKTSMVSKKSVVDDGVSSRKTSTLEEKGRKISAVEDEVSLRKTSTMSKKSTADDEVVSRKTSTIEGKSRKTSAIEEEAPSRKVSAMGKSQEALSRTASIMDEEALSREIPVIDDEKPQSRKVSEVEGTKPPSRKTSAIQEAKAPSRKTSEIRLSSRKTSAIEEEKVASRKSSAAQEKLPDRKTSSRMEEKAPSRKTSKMASIEQENFEVDEILGESAGTPQSRKTTMTKTETNEPQIESEVELASKEALVEAEEAEAIVETPIENDKVTLEDATAEVAEDEVPEAKKDNDEKYTAAVQRKSSTPAKQITRSPPRRRSPSPTRKRQEHSPSPVRTEVNRGVSYRSYDQDTYRQKGPPPRSPNYLSFSSYTPVERKVYTPISPWVQNATQKYRNEYTAVSTYKPSSVYTSLFDDIVSSGPFASSLYSTNRLLERSRSRSRELRNALRSRRSASNYYRYTSNYATPPLRTRDYSTPPLSSIYRPPSRSGSFISFMEYSGQKQYEFTRSSSRLSSSDGLSRASSRSSIDKFYNTGRLSRVDSYVRNLNRNSEYDTPSTYSKYRSSPRPYLMQDYTPVRGFSSWVHNSPLSFQRSSFSHTNSYIYNPTSRLHSLYWAYPITTSPSSSTLSRLYSGFARDWTTGRRN